MTAQDIQKALSQPFTPQQVEWLVILTNQEKTRALVCAYIDARTVEDRLDEVMGVASWKDNYDVLEGGCVLCTLQIKVDGVWVQRQDVGAPSEQPTAGDKLKAAVSDSLKRTAVHFGIGRYLARIPKCWADYDAKKKQIKQKPGLPTWALPEAVRAQVANPNGQKTERPRPELTSGEIFVRRLAKTEESWIKEGVCAKGEMFGRLVDWGEKEHGLDCTLEAWPDNLKDDIRNILADIKKSFIEDKARMAQPADVPPDSGETEIPW
jgi:hypothetical protein